MPICFYFFCVKTYLTDTLDFKDGKNFIFIANCFIQINVLFVYSFKKILRRFVKLICMKIIDYL